MAAKGSKLTGRMPALLLAGSMLAGVPGIAAAQEAAAEQRKVFSFPTRSHRHRPKVNDDLRASE